MPGSVQPPRLRVEALTPALEVSGDYYDVFALDTGRLALAAADVSGKGIPGLVVMAMLRTTLRSLATQGRDPVEVLAAASRMLRHSMRQGMFVTCVYGVLDTRTHRFTYASAGHCPPATFGPRGVTCRRGGAWGFDDMIFQSSLRGHTHLRAWTCACADGLPDMNAAAAAGTRPSSSSCEWTATDPIPIIETLCRRVGHRGLEAPSDDLALLALQRLEPVPAAASVPPVAGAPHAAGTHPTTELAPGEPRA
jgi:hypothetical protein